MKKLIFFLTLIFCIGFSSAAMLSDNLTLYYNFDQVSGNATEIVNRVYNGTNDFSVNQNVPGVVNLGAEFSDNYFNVTNNTGLDLGNSNFTVNVWINASSFAANKYIYSNDRSSHGTGLQILTLGRPRFIEDGNVHLGGINLTANAWHMVTIVGNQDNITIFTDGVWGGSDAYIGSHPVNPNQTMSIGSGIAGTLGNQNFTGRLDELAFWKRDLNITEITQLYNGGSGMPVSSLSITLDYPDPNTFIIDNPTGFNTTVTSGTDLDNVTYFIYHSNGTEFNVTTFEVSGLTNSTSFNVPLSVGNYTWNAEVCDTTNCMYGGSNISFFWGFIENAVNYNTTAYETDREKYILNLSLGSSTSSATFYYDGTAQGASTKTTSGSNTIFSNFLNIPVSDLGAKNFFWELNLDGKYVNTSVNQQDVNATSFGLCNATLTIPFYALNFKNETTNQERVNASISSTWQYYLGTGTTNKTATISNSSVNPEYDFCVIPRDRVLYVIPTVNYANSESQQRTFQPQLLTLTNSTKNKTLYLLPTSAGIFVTFQVINPGEQTIVGARINITSTTFGDIESKTTDSAGSAAFFLNPLTTYTITTSAAGYQTESLILSPSQTTYTIQLGSTLNTTQDDFTKGITTTILPSPGTILLNDTLYNFNFTIGSTFWNLDNFGFTLYNSSGSNLGSNSSTASSGGLVSAIINTGNQTNIEMVYFWAVNGTYSNASVYWIVRDTTGTSWSLTTLFTDLRTYITNGFFGLTDFGLAILAFLFILIFTGVMSYKFGLTSPAAIMALVFSLVLALDVGFGLVPNPIGAVPNFPTIFVLIIFAATLLREVSR